MTLVNPGRVREIVKQFYKDTELWLPRHTSHRIYRIQSFDDDGSTRFYRLRDRVSTVEKLRNHLLQHTPLNVYFSVSSWFNPSKTGKKTYADPEDGRMHRDKNGFMFTDEVIDMDHRDRGMVADLYYHVTETIPESEVDIVFSGDGFHVNVWDWFRDRTISDPIKREKKAYEEMQSFTRELIEHGFDFDYRIQGDSINSPSADTRRVRKLPGTLTSHGTVAEFVEIEELDSFTPTVICEAFETENKEENFVEFRDKVKDIAERTNND